jgi:cell division protein FtsI/penicillin-binding protein 2
MNDTVKLPEAAALGISVQLEFPGGTLVFQTHVPQETSKTDLDALTDKVIAVADRQRAKNTVTELKRNKESQLAQLLNLREDRDRIDAQIEAPAEDGRRKPKPDQSQVRAREQSVVMEQKLVDIIKRMDEQIAEAEGIIAGK